MQCEKSISYCALFRPEIQANNSLAHYRVKCTAPKRTLWGAKGPQGDPMTTKETFWKSKGPPEGTPSEFRGGLTTAN